METLITFEQWTNAPQKATIIDANSEIWIFVDQPTDSGVRRLKPPHRTTDDGFLFDTNYSEKNTIYDDRRQIVEELNNPKARVIMHMTTKSIVGFIVVILFGVVIIFSNC